MIHPSFSFKNFLLAIAVLACTAALLSIGWARPEPDVQLELGAEWQCSKKAAIMTVCTRTSQAEPLLDRARVDPVLWRRV